MRFRGICRDKIKADKLREKNACKRSKYMVRKMRMPKGMKKIRSIILVCGMVAGIILTVPELRAYADFTEQQDSAMTIDSVSSSSEPEASAATTKSTAQVATLQNVKMVKNTGTTSSKAAEDDSMERNSTLLAFFSTLFFGYNIIRRKTNKLNS